MKRTLEQPTQQQLTLMIDDIMKHFDFKKVHAVMVFVGHGSVTEMGKTPSVKKLTEKARELLQEVAALEYGGISMTGGFVARKEQVMSSSKKYRDDEGVELSLDFVLENKMYNSGWLNEVIQNPTGGVDATC
jgi:hypothetical protein